MERFAVQRSAARRIAARAVEGAARREAARWIPGSTYRNLRVSALLEALETDRLAFPAYVLTYEYRRKRYRVVVHGQDPRVVLGESPTSWIKVALVVVAVIGGVLVLLLMTIVMVMILANI